MEKYLIDTNAVSHLLTAKFPVSGIEFVKQIIDSEINISVITQIELLSWQTADSTELVIKTFIHDSNIIDLNVEIVDACVVLRRKKKIDTPDAIIAATALAHNYTLITGNEKDFQNIKGLKIVNPHKL